MASNEQNDSSHDPTDVPPTAEPAPTPLISAAQPPTSWFPTVHIPSSCYEMLREHARRRVTNGAYGTIENHETGLIGEYSFADIVGITDRLDTALYDGGDGGYDLSYRGATIDVKTVGRHREDPALTVDVHQPLRADYYVLAQRHGPTSCRVIGYAPRKFVADAPRLRYRGREYHLVDKEYLFPILMPPFLGAS